MKTLKLISLAIFLFIGSIPVLAGGMFYHPPADTVVITDPFELERLTALSTSIDSVVHDETDSLGTDTSIAQDLSEFHLGTLSLPRDTFYKYNIETGLHFKSDPPTLGYWNGMELKQIPLWTSIIPPLLAILLALIFKEVYIALFVGVFSGAFLINGASFSRFFKSLFDIADTYVIHAVSPTDGGTGHLSIIVFSMLIGGMVAVISNNGGMNGIVSKVSGIATSKRRAEFTTWLMGMIIFFDDYANTLVVGNTMRPLTDKYKVAREKLAYLVDSTAAPIAAIGLVTTWIGFQLAEIDNGIASQSFIELDINVYTLFLGSLKYALYPILTIFFVLILVLSKRGFGPMLAAEREALAKDYQTNGETVESKSNWSWLNGALPVLVLVVTVFAGILLTGRDDSMREMGFFEGLQYAMGNGDSYVALLWASMLGSVVAIFMSLISRSLSLKETIESFLEGLKTMLPAVVILVLAWALALVIEELHTADYLATLIPSYLSVLWIPFILFIVSAAVSFSTGSSWSTMAIMYPIAIPLVLKMAAMGGMEASPELFMPVLLNTISVILAASVFGDHCSPISDTTILSSLASDCNHIAHVRTQLPYALVVGVISLLCGCVLFALGIPWYINYLIGLVLIGLVIKFVAKPIENQAR